MNTKRIVTAALSTALVAGLVSGCWPSQSSAPRSAADTADQIIDDNASGIEKKMDEVEVDAGLTECGPQEAVGFYSSSAMQVPCYAFTPLCEVTAATKTAGGTATGNPAQCPLTMRSRSTTLAVTGAVAGAGSGALTINIKIGFDVTAVTKDTWAPSNLPQGQASAGDVTVERTLASEHASLSITGNAADGAGTMAIDGKYNDYFVRKQDFCKRIPVPARQCGG